MNEIFTCEFCKQVEYKCKWQLGGHLRHCTKRKEQLAADAFSLETANNIVNEIILQQFNYDNEGFEEVQIESVEDFVLNDDYIPENDITNPTFIEAYANATNAYLQRQKDLFNLEELQLLQSGFTKTLDGLRKQADIRIYLEICEFVSNCHGLSISECDSLLELIRRISFINGSEIPIPQKYYTIHDKIFKAVNEKSFRIVKTHYEHCEALFGKGNELGKIPAVVTDLLDLIANMFVDPDIGPFLHLEYEESKLYRHETINGKRQRTVDDVYGEFYQSEFFKLAQQEAREQWGLPNLKIVVVFLGIDATNLNQSGSVNATPIYLSLGNMSIDMLRSHIGIELCGYMPVSLASKAKQRSALELNGIKYETNQDDCIKLHSRWLEQECLNDFYAPIRWCEKNGPVYLWRGTETSGCLEPVIIINGGINSDNVGSNKLCGLYGLGCRCPCRTCICPSSELLNPSCFGYDIRNSEEAKYHLEVAFSAYCKKKKFRGKNHLSEREVEALAYCDAHSIYPLMLAVMNIEPPFKGFSAYEYYRQDLMHTLLGRLKTWTFSTIVIQNRICKKLKGKFQHSLANLDDALINFLPNHALPFPFYHFQNGITIFCKSSTDSKKSKLSTSGLGKIDYSRMVSLVLQMLISINERDDILSDDYFARGMSCSVKGAVLAAGWSLLDAYLSLNRKKITSEELMLAGKTLQTANYAYLIQNYYKQVLLNNPTIKDSKEIKGHYCGHMITFIKRDAVALVYNTTMLETAHKYLVKDTYRHSSMRHDGDGLVVDLYCRLNRGKLLRRSKAEFERLNNLESIKRKKEEKRLHVINVETEAGVVFECSTFKSDRQELTYHLTRQTWCLQPQKDNNMFLNPMCSMNYLIGQCYRDDILTECLEGIKTAQIGNVQSQVFLHRFFKLDGTAQGIPVCVLYAEKRKKRFDWYKNTVGNYVQIAALLECTMLEKTRLYVIGFHCTEAGVRASSTYPLPRIKYLITRNQPNMSCDSIDSIAEPVAVIPSSMRSSSYFELNLKNRSQETFCIIPLGFIYRDDWEESNNVQLTMFRSNLLTKFRLREYYNASNAQKNIEFQTIMHLIRNIGNAGGQVYSDEESIEEVIEMKRRINLEIKVSEYIIYAGLTAKSIGWGLFCKTNTIRKGDIITMYIGENIPNEEWNKRVKMGKGGYGLYVNTHTVKDCRESFSNQDCYASAVNCSKNIRHRITNEKGKHNAYLIIISGLIFLKCCTDILPGTEILLESYGLGYRLFPNSDLVKTFVFEP